MQPYPPSCPSGLGKGKQGQGVGCGLLLTAMLYPSNLGPAKSDPQLGGHRHLR